LGRVTQASAMLDRLPARAAFSQRGSVSMKKLIVAMGLFSLATSAFAAKPCEELKAEVDAKLKAKGVTSYTLEVVDKGSVTDKKVVGSCELGSKEIVYQRN